MTRYMHVAPLPAKGIEPRSPDGVQRNPGAVTLGRFTD